MVKFEEDANFICMKCGTEFLYTSEHFARCAKAGQMGCPKCKALCESSKHIKNFFKFYPRLIVSQAQLAQCGFEFVTYEVEQVMKLYHRIGDVVFNCTKCSGNSTFSFTRTKKFINEPGLFACKKCGYHPKPLKYVKEFFVSFRCTSESLLTTYGYMWDLFAPIQQPWRDQPKLTAYKTFGFGEEE